MSSARTASDAQIWERRFERERSARQQAELILEQKSAELYAANCALEEVKTSLESTVIERTAALQDAIEELRTEIDRREQVEQKLIEARDEAVEINRHKEEFLAKVSHEIRTPLNSIVGYTRLLRDAPLPQNEKERLESISGSCDILLRMVNDLLSVSRINAGKVVLELGPCNLTALVNEALTLVKLDADLKNIELSMQLAAGLPATVGLDVGRLQQVLINLVSNAVKYSDQGSVVVAVRLMDEHGLRMPAPIEGASDEQEIKRLEISVSDTGRGISAESLPSLFEPYMQVNSAAGEESGSGLGLTICDKLCRLMGGSISVESEVGRGSTFRFWLPCVVDAQASWNTQPGPGSTANDAASAQPAPCSAAASTDDLAPYRNMAIRHPLRILAADDNHVNRLVLQELLELLGYQTDVVSNGEEALRASRAVAYDAVLMDIRMPHLNGLEATRLIREEQDDGQRPFIVAVTADAVEGERERLLNGGMDAYLAKPVDISELARALEQAYDSRQRPTLPAAAEAFGNQPAPLNFEALHARLGTATDGLLKKVIPIFLRELPGRMVRLEAALQGRDYAEFGRVCHGLKGSSLSVGAELLAGICSSLQTSSESRRLPRTPEFEALQDLSHRTAAALNEKLESLC